jgi:hypothetical protein
MQTRRQSLTETLAGVAIGYAVALLSQLAIFPLFDVYLPLSDNMMIGAWFTVISIIRGYYVRRFFNWVHR